MSCDSNSELFELYALGVLDADEREQVESHLRDQCIRCTAGFRRAGVFNAAVLGSLPLEQPSAELRARVINSIRPKRATRPPFAWIAVAAGLAAATIWLGFENQQRSKELSLARVETRNLQQRSEELSRSLTFLRHPETRPAVSKPDANRPRGTYFVNPRSGVMLIASNLTVPAAGRAYEMWVIPKGQAPRPAGIFRPEADGTAIHLQAGPIDLSTVQAFAITEEPETGSTAPTTTPFLVTPAQGL